MRRSSTGYSTIQCAYDPLKNKNLITVSLLPVSSCFTSELASVSLCVITFFSYLYQEKWLYHCLRNPWGMSAARRSAPHAAAPQLHSFPGWGSWCRAEQLTLLLDMLPLFSLLFTPGAVQTDWNLGYKKPF